MLRSVFVLTLGYSVSLAEVEKSELTNLDTKIIYVVEGKSVNILAKAGIGRIIQFCRWDAVNNSKVGNNGLIFVNDVDEIPSFSIMANQQSDDKNKSRDVIGYEFFGDGLSSGECGITIRNVTPEDITTWKYLLIEFSKIEGNPKAVTRDIKLEQAVQPTRPQILEKDVLENMMESTDGVDAQKIILCCAENGIPQPDLRFIFDNAEILYSMEQENGVRNSKTCISTRVNFTRQNDGKILKCVSEHLTFGGQQEDSMELNVGYVPEILSDLTDRQNRTLQISFPSEDMDYITLRFTANPEPVITWHLQNPIDGNFVENIPSKFSIVKTSSSDMCTWYSTLTLKPEALNASGTYTFKIVASNNFGTTEVFVVANVDFIQLAGTAPPTEQPFAYYWLLIPLIIFLILMILAIIFLILARANGWACWRNHTASYDTQERGKDIVYNPVMTTTEDP